MQEDFSCQIKEEKETLHCFLRGAITEHADFSMILSKPKKSIVLDLFEVKRINSKGVGFWASFLKKLSSLNTNLVLERCSSAMVQQMNTIRNLNQGAKVRSVVLPYVCLDCGKEYNKIHLLKYVESKEIEEFIKCKECDGMMEFDDLPAIYLSFLSED